MPHKIKSIKEAAAMSEDFGPNFISLTDEDGNEFELERLVTV